MCLFFYEAISQRKDLNSIINNDFFLTIELFAYDNLIDIVAPTLSFHYFAMQDKKVCQLICKY
jgi:hypothetical protein